MRAFVPYKFFTILCLLLGCSVAEARLEVCNQTDLVLIVSVGYDTAPDRTVSEGWWKLYPGFCEVPVDVAMLKGSYYVHAESNPRSTMPNDGFTYGEKVPLCVELNDFRKPNARLCEEGGVVVGFEQLEKTFRNQNRVDITHSERLYPSLFAAQVAGSQRLLAIVGYEIDTIDGELDQETVAALAQLGTARRLFGFDFRGIFQALEQIIAEQQKLDN